MNYIRLLLFACGTIFFLFAGAFFFLVNNHRVDFVALEHYNPGKYSVVFDDEGNEWARFALDKREHVELRDVPSHVVNSFIAAEDHDFFSHCGISIKGIIRSTLVNIYHGKIVQGASTITQQLVRLLFFDNKRTFVRKIKEQLFSLFVERQFTKDYILQTYLNHVYFGCGIYGVEAASQRFWGKSIVDVTVDQAAMLAAIMKSPWHYCPLLFPLSAKKRRNTVLHSMCMMKFISKDEFEHYKTVDLGIVDHDKTLLAPHAKESIRVFLEKRFGKELLYSGGLRIQTTINMQIQKKAESVFASHVEKIKNRLQSNIDGALICMEGKTGEIKGLVGGVQFSTSQFNRALQAKRQFGSIFKPIVYAAAIAAGKHFDQLEIDEPFELSLPSGIWEPRNDSRQYEGSITLARALSHSNNIITVKMLLFAGIQAVVNIAQKLHLSGDIKPYPSLALGCIDGTLSEAVGLFNIFAQHGRYVEPHMIKWVKDQWGKKIFKRRVAYEVVLNSWVSDQVAKVLSLGMNRMKLRYKNEWIDSEAIGKTGTTNDARTSWFMGATPDYTTGIYIGCDDNTSMGVNVYGSQTAFPIWLFLNRDLANKKKFFSYNTALKRVLIDSITGRPVKRAGEPRAIEILVPNSVST